MVNIKRALVLLIYCLLTGCSPEVCEFTNADDCSFKSVSELELNSNTIVLIYLSGSKQENEPDPCVPYEKNHGYGVPSVIRTTYQKLSKSYDVKLLGYCTPSKTSHYDGRDLTKKPKVMLRAQDTIDLLTALKKQGADPARIFLSGHSAGGWSSLLAQKSHPELCKGVIAIAPAFAGTTQGRYAPMQQLRDDMANQFKISQNMNALIYAFEQDRYENSQTLSFFKRVKGVKVKNIEGSDLQALKCPHRAMHYMPFEECFTPISNELTKYIQSQIY